MPPAAATDILDDVKRWLISLLALSAMVVTFAAGCSPSSSPRATSTPGGHGGRGRLSLTGGSVRSSAGGRRRIADEGDRSADDLVEHVRGQPAGERVLLARVVGAEKDVRPDPHLGAMAEPRLRPDLETSDCERPESRVPPERTDCDDHADPGQESKFAPQE